MDSDIMSNQYANYLTFIIRMSNSLHIHSQVRHSNDKCQNDLNFTLFYIRHSNKKRQNDLTFEVKVIVRRKSRSRLTLEANESQIEGQG